MPVCVSGGTTPSNMANICGEQKVIHMSCLLKHASMLREMFLEGNLQNKLHFHSKFLVNANTPVLFFEHVLTKL